VFDLNEGKVCCECQSNPSYLTLQCALLVLMLCMRVILVCHELALTSKDAFECWCDYGMFDDVSSLWELYQCPVTFGI